jgi:hypothetical protein
MQERKKQIESVDKATYSIPEAGAMVDLSRNGAYDAARRGEIPVLQFGRKKVVPKALWDRKLGLDKEQQPPQAPAPKAELDEHDRNLAARIPQRGNEQPESKSEVVQSTAPGTSKRARGRPRRESEAQPSVGSR